MVMRRPPRNLITDERHDVGDLGTVSAESVRRMIGARETEGNTADDLPIGFQTEMSADHVGIESQEACGTVATPKASAAKRKLAT
jgi:hypothetical protein